MRHYLDPEFFIRFIVCVSVLSEGGISADFS